MKNLLVRFVKDNSGATAIARPNPTTKVPIATNTTRPEPVPVPVSVQIRAPDAAISGPTVMNRRGPSRPASEPNRPDSRISSTVDGRPISAATVAGSCSTCCT